MARRGAPYKADRTSPTLPVTEGGHLEVLKWARANGCPWDEDTCEAAAEGGQLEVLEWAVANGCPSFNSSN
tara:strand:- start:44 stop:256 length:213 start_codon:yes stop_codon:yes gene_type:complete